MVNYFLCQCLLTSFLVLQSLPSLPSITKVYLSLFKLSKDHLPTHGELFGAQNVIYSTELDHWNSCNVLKCQQSALLIFVTIVSQGYGICISKNTSLGSLQYVIAKQSLVFTITTCISQGSVLGPLHFLISTNDVTCVVSDDIALFQVIHSPNDLNINTVTVASTDTQTEEAGQGGHPWMVHWMVRLCQQSRCPSIGGPRMVRLCEYSRLPFMDGPWIYLVTPLLAIQNSQLSLTFMDDTGLSMAAPDIPGSSTPRKCVSSQIIFQVILKPLLLNPNNSVGAVTVQSLCSLLSSLLYDGMFIHDVL